MLTAPSTDRGRQRISIHNGPRWIRAQPFAEGLAEVIRNRRILLTSAAEIGWLFGLQTVTMLAARPLLGIASDRIGRRGLIVVGMVVCGAAVWTISIAPSAGGLFASVIAYAAGVAVTSAATSAYITDVAPRARYGAAHGVFGTIYDVGDAAGPILAGLLVAAWGYASMLQVIATVTMMVAGLFYVLQDQGASGGGGSDTGISVGSGEPANILATE